MVEHLLGRQGVRGSSPLTSTGESAGQGTNVLTAKISVGSARQRSASGNRLRGGRRVLEPAETASPDQQTDAERFDICRTVSG